MIKRVEDSYKNNIVKIVFGPLIKLIEAVFDLLIPLFMKAIIDLNQYDDPDLIPNSLSLGLAKFIRSFGVWIPDNQNLSDALVGGMIILVMSLFGFAITMLAQYVAAKTAVNVGSEIRTSLFEKILSLSKKERDKFGNAKLQTTLNSDTYQVERGVLIFVRLIARAPFVVLGSIIFSFILDWKIGLAFTCIVPILLISLILILKKSGNKYSLIQSNLDDISNHSKDTIEGARVVRAFGAQKYEEDKFNEVNSVYKNEQLIVQKNNALINPIIFEVTSLVSIIIIFLLMNVLFNSSDSIKVVLTSSLIAAMAYLAQIFFATVQLSNVLLDLTRARVSRKRINEILGVNNQIVSGNIVSEPNDELLEFKNVSFSFSDDMDHLALSDISFSLKKGETLGIIGGTGSGKSTIINLIERFIDPTVGEIRYNNIPLKEYDISSIRNDIGLVSQKSVLFDGSIKDNFLIANPDIKDEEIIAALKESCAYDFVYKYEDNLNHEIKEGGVNLSGGQRQRICIARALAKNPSLLILDDSTSALDLLTEKTIRNNIKNRIDMTKIIVSQRISSVMDSDLIIVLEKGKIVASGTHEELLKNSDIYRDIAATQINKG